MIVAQTLELHKSLISWAVVALLGTSIYVAILSPFANHILGVRAQMALSGERVAALEDRIAQFETELNEKHELLRSQSLDLRSISSVETAEATLTKASAILKTDEDTPLGQTPQIKRQAGPAENLSLVQADLQMTAPWAEVITKLQALLDAYPHILISNAHIAPSTRNTAAVDIRLRMELLARSAEPPSVEERSDGPS